MSSGFVSRQSPAAPRGYIYLSTYLPTYLVGTRFHLCLLDHPPSRFTYTQTYHLHYPVSNPLHRFMYTKVHTRPLCADIYLPSGQDATAVPSLKKCPSLDLLSPPISGVDDLRNNPPASLFRCNNECER